MEIANNEMRLREVCTYATCNKRFATIKDMKAHKSSDPDHDYCKKCDVDCLDWEDFLHHKVDAMAPWVEGRVGPDSGESPKHICCEFCGMDFKSFGGRRLHREQSHRAEQNIKCPGCRKTFTSGAGYIAHFERGDCTSVTKQDFKGSVQQKQMVKEIMKAPEKFNTGSDSRVDPDDFALWSPNSQGDEEGGVALSIMDDEGESQALDHTPLEAVRLPTGNEHAKQTDVNTEVSHHAWPALPGQDVLHLGNALGNLNTKSSTRSTATGALSASEYAQSITDWRMATGLLKHRRSEIGFSGETSAADEVATYTPSETEDEAVYRTSDATKTKLPHERGVWTVGNSSQKLFQDAKPTPRPGDWQGILKQREEEVLANESSNLFHVRFWDPNSKDYNLHQFFQPTINKYCCPLHGIVDCQGVFETKDELCEHMQLVHSKENYRCPSCLKIFQAASALVAHAESAGRCRVKHSKNYKKLLDEVTGGFLKAKFMEQPSIYRKETAALAKGTGDPISGLMDVKFTAKMPDEQ